MRRKSVSEHAVQYGYRLLHFTEYALWRWSFGCNGGASLDDGQPCPLN
ncbi:MAG: hypothetical protein PHU14_10775 [Methylovulum sp.]|nr:hypothetical protein [Methylovulum sp.]